MRLLVTVVGATAPAPRGTAGKAVEKDVVEQAVPEGAGLIGGVCRDADTVPELGEGAGRAGLAPGAAPPVVQEGGHAAKPWSLLPHLTHT